MTNSDGNGCVDAPVDFRDLVVFCEQYENTKPLRYGHVMLMTDQDHDGSHIKGLIINLFQCFWPSLLKIPGFLVEFITPIVKCTKGKFSFLRVVVLGTSKVVLLAYVKLSKQRPL